MRKKNPDKSECSFPNGPADGGSSHPGLHERSDLRNYFSKLVPSRNRRPLKQLRDQVLPEQQVNAFQFF